MGTGDLSLACVSLLVDELVHGGMRHACVSPGSRSTPLALALDRHPDVTVHVHLDERSSAFFALGVAKASGGLAAVACTSGTAAANFLPAVVEASQARVPMVVLTADRPPRVRGTGANQTIDQVGLYGRYVRRFVDAPLPAEGPRTAETWRRIGAEVVGSALEYPPQPVHVNLPMEEPLAPEGAAPAIGEAKPLTERYGAVLVAAGLREPGGLDEIDAATARFLREFDTPRGAVVAGAMPDHAEDVADAALALRWPLIAEPTSGARHLRPALSAGQALLGCESWIRDHRPEVVLQVGATPTSRATQTFVASAERLIVLDAFHRDPDPERRAAWRIELGPAGVCSRIWERTIRDERDRRWLDTWLTADAVARQAIDDRLDSWEEPYEGRVARDLAAALPDGATLVVGSSMPIRDLDYYMAPRERLRVLANRGASGIDGFVSTTLGVAATGVPTFALCGDLTLLHDAGSLLWSARGSSAVFVVPNNEGGAIFSFMAQRMLPEHERLFATPHGLDLGAVCTAAGARHVRIDRADEIVASVERAKAEGGVHVVEVASDRERNVARHAEVSGAVAAALASS
jgi:2-succinyl-5-enolpyruvyl-6-hydroxy-3-cyclohexene-1-carboxylate synthase